MFTFSLQFLCCLYFSQSAYLCCTVSICITVSVGLFSCSNFLILSEYCQKFSGIIPVNLVLGFYVSQIIGRFYGQFNSLPWISRLAVFVNMHIRGDDDVSRLLRRTIVRYMCLSSVLCLASICPNVKKRFPTLKHLTDAGNFFN